MAHIGLIDERLAVSLGLSVTRHLPLGTGKWNKISPVLIHYPQTGANNSLPPRPPTPA